MTKIKVILLDIDGVLIRLPQCFSMELEKQGYSNVIESLEPFYHGSNRQCLEGRADVEAIIMPYLKKIGWTKTAAEYFSQQFVFESKYFDKTFISLVKNFQNKNIACYLCTDQENNRAKFLLDEMNFSNIFDGYFISCYVGYRKCHDNFWIHTISKLQEKFPNIKSNEIAFFDDRQGNIDTALKFGIKAFLFTDMNKFEKDLFLLGLK